MKVLLVGNGGRENAIAHKISESPSFKRSGGKLFTAKGNPGIRKYSELTCISPDDIISLAEFALKEKIDLTVTGPEVPLSLGITDEFEKRGLRIFGPSKLAAEIETSKVFAKKLMKEYNIPTAEYRAFKKEETDEALKYLNDFTFPAVFKADGLAAGKGVIIAGNIQESMEVLNLFSDEKNLKEAGENFIIEEYLDGEEVSVFAVCDGKDFVMLPFSQDHKRISDGEKGRNTGGMGAVAPVRKFMTEDINNKIKERIIIPVLKAMRESGREFRGCLYCGLMIVKGDPFVIEFNCRFGDPETQAVLQLIDSDFLGMLQSAAEKNLKNYKLETNDKFSCCVVLASGGYPGEYETGKKITGIDDITGNCFVYHSGTRYGNKENEVLTDGGRVLSVTGISDKSMNDAVKIAYENAGKINFENKYFRKDIGFRQLKNNYGN
ncbi:MAG: phosphoribosylamine--glycine ligase [Ignavibacteria bacterium]|nr:phosphoribosylamine--glycine ligase [Ignavibacteria bacterium]